MILYCRVVASHNNGHELYNDVFKSETFKEMVEEIQGDANWYKQFVRCIPLLTRKHWQIRLVALSF